MNMKKPWRSSCTCIGRPSSRAMMTLAAVTAGFGLSATANAQMGVDTLHQHSLNKANKTATHTDRVVGFGDVGVSGERGMATSTVTIDFDVTGIESIAALGDPANEVFNLDIGADAFVVGVSWDVTLEAFSPSWIADMRLQFTDSAETAGVWLTPGVGDNFPGVGAYSGDVNLIDVGLDFQVGADGILRLEFWEDFVDFPSPQPDGIWLSGTLSFVISDEPPPPPDACIDGVGDCCEAQDGSPGCDDEDCCNLICGQDPFCCNTNWDSICAGAAQDQCEICTPEPDCGVDGTGNCCQPGGNGSPFCDDEDCCDLICDQDPFCCNTEWDSACAAAAESQCSVCDEIVCGHPDAGNCCEGQTGSPFCDDADCCNCICACDSFCCSTNWDSLCAGGGIGGCGASNPDGLCTAECSQCLPEPECGQAGTGDCCEANGTPFCDDEECCNLICDQDSFCCDTEWDSLCADQANDQCEACIGCGDEGAGDCCEGQTGSPFCDDADCCDCICACDSFCCTTNWDSLCAGGGLGGCGASNPDGPCTAECSQCLPDPEGCSLGFWKNNTDQWVGYDPDDLFDEVFGSVVAAESDCCVAQTGSPGCDDPDCEAAVCADDPFCCNTNWDSLCANAAVNTFCVELCEDSFEPLGVFGDCTLHDVISSPSGGPNACSGTPQANNLGKQAVAALLNASSAVEYPMSEEEVLDAVADAFQAWLDGAHHNVLTSLQAELDELNNIGCPDLNMADLNYDGSVDIEDLMILLQHWGPVTGEARVADLNQDGHVDIEDLMILLANWGEHTTGWQR